jgi:hypothetical protein
LETPEEDIHPKMFLQLIYNYGTFIYRYSHTTHTAEREKKRAEREKRAERARKSFFFLNI